MSPLRGNTANKAASGAKPAPAHRLTADLARSEKLAAMIARSRASRVVEISDLLAGMYIYEWERLAKYWEVPEAIEASLQQICRISPQRWHQWMQFHEGQQSERERGRTPRWLRLFMPAADAAASEEPPERSSALASLLREAERIAPYRDNPSGGGIPILTSECVLLCIARSTKSELGRKIARSGIDLDRLEQDALRPKHAPLR